MPAKQKITDDQFSEAFTECHGNYAQTAQYIQTSFNVPYTRQAVCDRAKNFPGLLDKITRLYLDHCEARLMAVAEDQTVDLKLRVRIYLQLLDKLMRLEQLKQRVTKPRREGVFDLNGTIIHFPGSDNPTPNIKETILNALNKKN